MTSPRYAYKAVTITLGHPFPKTRPRAAAMGTDSWAEGHGTGGVVGDDPMAC